MKITEIERNIIHIQVDGSWDGPTPECLSDGASDVRPLRTGAPIVETSPPKRRTPPFRRKPITTEVEATEG